MRHKRRVLFTAGACVVLLLAGAAVLAFNARVADHFGYALPGATGLPSRIAYADRHYSTNGTCWSSTQLQQRGMWPLHEVAQVPTLLGPARPVLSDAVPPGMTTTMTLVIPKAQCYAVYSLEGGP